MSMAQVWRRYGEGTNESVVVVWLVRTFCMPQMYLSKVRKMFGAPTVKQ